MRLLRFCPALLLVLVAPGLRAAGPAVAGEDGATYPQLLHRVSPRFPERPREAHISGAVILEAVVRTDGTVGDLRVVRAGPTGYGFEQSAVEAVRQWRYEPGTRNGEPVDVVFLVTVEFLLQGGGVAPPLPVDVEFEERLWTAGREREYGNLDAALDELLAAVERAGSFPRRDPRRPLALNRAADLYLERGEDAEAGSLLARSVEATRKAHGKRSLELLEPMGKLCAVHVAQEHWFDAEELIEEAIRILERDGKHPEALAWWLERHRRVLVATGRVDQAAAVAERARRLVAPQAP